MCQGRSWTRRYSGSDKIFGLSPVEIWLTPFNRAFAGHWLPMAKDEQAAKQIITICLDYRMIT